MRKVIPVTRVIINFNIIRSDNADAMMLRLFTSFLLKTNELVRDNTRGSILGASNEAR